jgi:transient receptor potential cation channel subfamily M protein 2
MVFVVSYSIAAHSIMFPNSELSFVLVYNVMRMGYWNLYGELFLEDIESKFVCKSFCAVLMEDIKI